jgi:hypothetical protein
MALCHCFHPTGHFGKHAKVVKELPHSKKSNGLFLVMAHKYSLYEELYPISGYPRVVLGSHSRTGSKDIEAHLQGWGGG